MPYSISRSLCKEAVSGYIHWEEETVVGTSPSLVKGNLLLHCTWTRGRSYHSHAYEVLVIMVSVSIMRMHSGLHPPPTEAFDPFCVVCVCVFFM